MYDKDFWIPNSWPHRSIISPPAPFLHYSHTSHDLQNTWFEVRWIRDIINKQIFSEFHRSALVVYRLEAQLLIPMGIQNSPRFKTQFTHVNNTYGNHFYQWHVISIFLDLKTLVFAMFGLKKKTARPQNKVFSRPPICENAILRCGNAIFR